MEVTSEPSAWQDNYDRDQRERMETLLDDITNGVHDDYLEAILAAAHGRKRAKRGVRNARGLSRA